MNYEGRRRSLISSVGLDVAVDVKQNAPHAHLFNERDILVYLYAPPPRRSRSVAVARSSPPRTGRSVSQRLQSPHGSRLYYHHPFLIRDVSLSASPP